MIELRGEVDLNGLVEGKLSSVVESNKEDKRSGVIEYTTAWSSSSMLTLS